MMSVEADQIAHTFGGHHFRKFCDFITSFLRFSLPSLFWRSKTGCCRVQPLKYNAGSGNPTEGGDEKILWRACT